MFDFIKNKVFNKNRYRTSSEAVVVSCFFNPQNSPYRLLAFQKFYSSIKHLNHRIIECVIGDAQPQLPDSPYITRVHSNTLLWHKEALLNKIISELPPEFKYVFWVDADVKFTNLNWMTDSVKLLKNDCNILQPFEYCVHLEKNQNEPSFNPDEFKMPPSQRVARLDIYFKSLALRKKMWRSFCANFVDTNNSHNENYDIHGHVGFAWGARRSLLEKIPLYDRALIGGADHIIAHSAAGHIPHECIRKSFKDDIVEVEKWMNRFYEVCQARIGFVSGDLYHYWHGDIKKRQYLKRIQDFTEKSKDILEKDENGLYVNPNNKYVKDYFEDREVSGFDEILEEDQTNFLNEMGYLITDYLVQSSEQESPIEDPVEIPVENADNHIMGVGSDVVENYPDNEPSSDPNADYPDNGNFS